MAKTNTNMSVHHFREDVIALEHGQQVLKDLSEAKTAENDMSL